MSRRSEDTHNLADVPSVAPNISPIQTEIHVADLAPHLARVHVCIHVTPRVCHRGGKGHEFRIFIKIFNGKACNIGRHLNNFKAWKRLLLPGCICNLGCFLAPGNGNTKCPSIRSSERVTFNP
jgi:hypothetical protein